MDRKRLERNFSPKRSLDWSKLLTCNRIKRKMDASRHPDADIFIRVIFSSYIL